MKLATKIAGCMPATHPMKQELVREAVVLEEFCEVTREHNRVLQRRLDRALAWIDAKEREAKANG